MLVRTLVALLETPMVRLAAMLGEDHRRSWFLVPLSKVRSCYTNGECLDLLDLGIELLEVDHQ